MQGMTDIADGETNALRGQVLLEPDMSDLETKDSEARQVYRL